MTIILMFCWLVIGQGAWWLAEYNWPYVYDHPHSWPIWNYLFLIFGLFSLIVVIIRWMFLGSDDHAKH